MGESSSSNTAGNVGPGASLFQARSIGQVNQYFHGERPPLESADQDPWVERAGESPLWRLVPVDRDVEPFRRATVEFVGKLVPLRDEADSRLSDDPWLDPGVPLRFHERLTQLLDSPGRVKDTDLYPAEAALLVLIPFLFRVYELRRAAERATLGPGTLAAVASPSPERASFEAFAAEYRGLTERVLRRGQDEEAVGWWLFHRWMAKAENSTGVEDLWGMAPDLFHRLWKPDRIRHVLHGLRLGRGVCNGEYLAGLREDEYVPAEGAQHLRERRLVLILALGIGMAPEPTSLPDTVVEHLAIPFPVDPARVRETVSGAWWGGDPHLLSLNAECGHEAVIEGLHQYVQRVDELLHGIHLALRGRFAQLPARLSSDRVEPAKGSFESWARFRIDERRARELLTGEQLYKNKDLAIRELYQNALDACRYRRARTEYLDRTSLASYTYEGSIEFTQGVDEAGRPYVDCSDNGVGMGEEELRGVFSHAGSRFAEESGFLMEQERWAREDPPILLYPNSRFGIGVLSYFMLADEIRVTTCRMSADGALGPELEAAIHGPGHLFRVVRTERARRTPGTTVRLYLNTDQLGAQWSSVRALRNELILSEFTTAATSGAEREHWLAGEINTAGLREPVESYGKLRGSPLPWDGAPEGVDFYWCEGPGTILVDGLKVQMSNSWESSYPAARSYGFVINFSGPRALFSLSVDRSKVVSDISPDILDLMAGAVEALTIEGGLLCDDDWFLKVVGKNYQTGDILAGISSGGHSGGGAHGRRLCLAGHGFVPLDGVLLGIDPGDHLGGYQVGVVQENITYPVEAGLLLWRLLVLGEGGVAEELMDMCQGLPDSRDLRSGVPTDQILMVGGDYQYRTDLLGALRQGSKWGMNSADVVRRWSRLGVFGGEPSVPGWNVYRILGQSGMRELFEEGEIRLEGEVGPADLAQLAISKGVTKEQAANMVSGFGAVVSGGVVEESKLPHVDRLCGLLSGERRRGSLSLDSIARELRLPHAETCRLLVNMRRDVLAGVLAKNALVSFCFDREMSRPEALRFGRELLGFFDPGEIKYGDLLAGDENDDIAADEAMQRFREFGVDVPSEFSFSKATAGGRSLHLREWLLGLQGLPLGSPVPLASVLSFARKYNIDRVDVMDELSNAGIYSARNDLPDGLSYDAALGLLRRNVMGNYFLDLNVDAALSVSHLVVRAQRMGVSLAEIIRWYNDLGYKVPNLEKLLPHAIPHIPRR